MGSVPWGRPAATCRGSRTADGRTAGRGKREWAMGKSTGCAVPIAHHPFPIPRPYGTTAAFGSNRMIHNPEFMSFTKARLFFTTTPQVIVAFGVFPFGLVGW